MFEDNFVSITEEYDGSQLTGDHENDMKKVKTNIDSFVVSIICVCGIKRSVSALRWEDDGFDARPKPRHSQRR